MSNEFPFGDMEEEIAKAAGIDYPIGAGIPQGFAANPVPAPDPEDKKIVFPRAVINDPQISMDPDLVFHDISKEMWRAYVYPSPDGDGVVEIKIDNPVAVAMKAPSETFARGGRHRILDADGVSHYIPQGWVDMKWKNAPGTPRFGF